MISNLLLNCDATSIQREVEEELQFHLDMSAREYESQGFSVDEARVLANHRLGDVSGIKKQCLQISMRKRMRVKAISILCSVIFVLGILINASSANLDIAQVGTVLIIIALSGGLLTFVKTLTVFHLVPNRKLIRLGLNSEADRGTNGSSAQVGRPS